jgi:hypothetical protein
MTRYWLAVQVLTIGLGIWAGLRLFEALST